ncbi:MFS transporter [Streptomyces sp. CA-111067]|uniref:MFS transporter n=1 Tax=Streptomyces sp. CA-111067 TaxID=3240046 RepID=UPI003D9881FC
MTAADESDLTTATAPAAASKERPGALWRHRVYRRYLGAEAVSLSGSAVSGLALPALAVVELHASSGQVALLAFLGQLPNFVIALPSGALADRYAKRPMMIAGDLVSAAVLASIPLVALLGTLTVVQLYAVAVLLGTAKVVHDAAAVSYLPAVVEPALLQGANSRLSAVFSLADSAGSSAGAALVAALGAARSVTADAVSYLASAWLVAGIRAAEPAPVQSGRRLRAEIWEGLVYVARHRVIRPVIAAIAVASFAQGIVSTYWIFYLLTGLHFSATALGVMLGCANAGSLAGALLAPRMTRRLGPGPLMIITLLGLPLTQTPLLIAGPGRLWQIVLGAALAVQLFCTAACGTTQRTVRQMICAPRLQGRMQQASTTLTAGSRPFGALVAGGLAELAGVRPVLVLGTVLLLAPVAVMCLSPLRTLHALPASPQPAVPQARNGLTRP